MALGRLLRKTPLLWSWTSQPLKLLLAFAFAGYIASRFGAWLGTFFASGVPDAPLYGMAAVFVAAGVLFYEMQDRFIVATATGILAAHFYGRQIGYSMYFAHFDLQADIYGDGTAFMGGFLAGGVLVWPILRIAGADSIGQIAAGWQRFAESRNKPAPLTLAQLEKKLEAGMVFDYRGLVDRDFATDQGFPSKERIRVDFTVQRNTMSMPPRERTAVRMWHALTSADMLNRKQADRLRFAIAWGDGRAEVYAGQYTAFKATLQKHGIKNHRDLISLEAGYRNVSIDSAWSELFTALQRAAAMPHAVPDVVKLHKFLTRNSG